MSEELKRLAAACCFASFPGLEAPEWVLDEIEGGLGGLCLFAYNVRDGGQLDRLTASLRAVRADLLLGIDEEGGDVTRLEGVRGSSYPGNGALGAVDDVALTERVAAAIGADLRAVGINLDLAPVADVNVRAANPVIGIRSFGADQELVARHVAAFVRGLQRQGVAACAKHFPGHGSTERDSHLELPVVIGDVADGLMPFRAAIDAGVETIMTAHVRVPALDEAPATLSPSVVTQLLRRELGYRGLVLADALEMRAVSQTVGVAHGAVLALAAGVDAVLLGHDLGKDAAVGVQRELVAAVAAGDLPEERLREAAGRVAEVGARAASAPAGGPVDREAGREAARRALRVEGDVRLGVRPLVVELRPQANIAAGEALHSVGEVLAERDPGTGSLVLDQTTARPESVRGIAGGRPIVIIVRDAHRHHWMREFADRLPSAVIVEIGLPLWRPVRSRGYAATYGGSRVSYEALADRLLDRDLVTA
jgi:beta-N-acetylhexosaminidase